MKRKTVLITGASRGIGAACARRFSRAGYAVALGYHRSQAEALALEAELRAQGAEALALRADVSDSAQVEAMVAHVLTHFGGLDVLVCNAGVAWQGLLGDMTDAQWRNLFSVNVDGVFYCCRAAIPHLVRQKSGHIITLSSVWGLTGASCEAAYAAGKAAVIGLTRSLAKELGPSGITVNCVAPGVIDTEMNGALSPEAVAALQDETPLGVVGSPEDVAESVLFLSDKGGRFITGQVLQPNGGLFIG